MDSEGSSKDSIGGKEKKCLVCGDKALGYNFNAISCESCKAFFRRNALKDKDFKCPFERKCEINAVTRRFCQLCRLIKCFEVGMKKEYIMTEEDKREKRKKIQENKAGRHTKDGEKEVADSSEEEGTPKKFRGEDLSNPLNMASEVSKQYRRPERVPYSSPTMTEPSSPVGSVLTDSRQSPIFIPFESNKSRSVEIYQISKISESTRPLLPQYNVSEKCDSGSSIIQNILSADHHRELTPTEMIDCKPSSSRMNEFRYKQELPKASRKAMPLLSSLVECAPEQSQRSHSFQSDLAKEVLRDIPRSSRNDMATSIESILSEAIKLEFEAYSSMNPRINSRELNDAERAKLNELIVANKALLAPVDDDISSLVSQEAMCKDNLGSRPMLVDVLNLTAVAIRRLIKMAKKVNAFKNMCQEDQVALLKGGCTEMMILRSAIIYDSDRGSWKIPHTNLMNINVDVLKEAGGKVFEEHQRFLQTFDPKWRNDENIMLILSAITLFTPDRPKVVHSDVIKLEQNSYYYLLRRYLESTYPGCEARSTFLKLIQKIAELHRLNEDHVRVYMELNPEDVEPLLIEIFDLNPH